MSEKYKVYMKKILLTSFLLSLWPTQLIAEHQHDHHVDIVKPTKPLTEINVAANEAVVQVSGVVCSFCAYGLRKNISKLSFIDRSRFKSGVYVDIEEQRVTLALLPGHALDVVALQKAIISGGYEPIRLYQGSENGNVSIHEFGEKNE